MNTAAAPTGRRLASTWFAVLLGLALVLCGPRPGFAQFSAAGSAVALERPGRVVRYQRGGRKLTYASTTVTGTLTVKREADRMRGRVSLTASAPIVNVTGGSDDVTRPVAFELDRK